MNPMRCRGRSAMGNNTVRISIDYCLKSGCAAILLAFLAVLFAASLSPAQEPEGPAVIPAGVSEFEDSPFCQKHECRLETIEPLRLRGVIDCWFYNYIFYGNSNRPPTRFGLRLSPAGDRASPYMILRWFPVATLRDIDWAAARDYLRDIIGDQAESVIPFIREFAGTQLRIKKRPANSEPSSHKMKAGDFTFYCTYTPGRPPRYPQFTLLVESDKPADHQKKP